MAAKKTAKKSGNVGAARAAQKQIAEQASTNDGPKYATIGDVMRAAGKGGLPRGAMFVIGDGAVELRAKMRGVIETLYAGNVDDVARWGLRKAGFKADHAA